MVAGLYNLEQYMCNYSSAKLELLVLKWATTEKSHDYLLGLEFAVYTDNNPMTLLGAVNEMYHKSRGWANCKLGKFNKAAGTLSRH